MYAVKGIGDRSYLGSLDKIFMEKKYTTAVLTFLSNILLKVFTCVALNQGLFEDSRD